MHSIRKALNHEMVLGRGDFIEKIKQMTDRRVEPGVMGRPKVEEGMGVYLVI